MCVPTPSVRKGHSLTKPSGQFGCGRRVCAKKEEGQSADVMHSKQLELLEPELLLDSHSAQLAHGPLTLRCLERSSRSSLTQYGMEGI